MNDQLINNFPLQIAILKANFNSSLDIKIREYSHDKGMNNNEFMTKRNELLKLHIELTEKEIQELNFYRECSK